MTKKTKSLEEWCHENNQDELLDEWNFEKDIYSERLIQPSNIPYDCAFNASWKCSMGHEWKSTVVARTKFQLKCPICNPEKSYLPIGTNNGCLTIIGGFEDYRKKVVDNVVANLEKAKADFLQGKREQGLHATVEYFDHQISNYKNRLYYMCQCKCGQIRCLDELHFLEKRHRYCTYFDAYDPTNFSVPTHLNYIECGLKTKHRDNLVKSYQRVYDESYNTDYSNTVHESLKILECVDDNHEEFFSWTDKRKKGGVTYKIYKLYRCHCYLCGKEQILKSSSFSINSPPSSGYRAYDGYYSEAHCDCHKISSFQWIVTKILIANNVPYRVEVSFPDLYGTGHVNKLRYDFSILDSDGNIKCLIECQGEQHFRPVDEFGGESQFEAQKKNDDLKRAYASEHGIPLYEIPYTSKKYEKVEAFLRSKNII